MEKTKVDEFRIGMGTSLLINGERLTSVTSIGEIVESSEEIEATTLDSNGSREYIAGLSDAGSMTVDGNVDKENYKTLKAYKNAGQLVTVAIYNKDLEDINAEFDAIVKSVTRGAIEVEGIISYSVEFKISGHVRDYTGPTEE